MSTGQPFNPAGESVPGYYKALDFLPGANVYKTPTGDYKAAGWLSTGVSNFLPFLGTGERLAAGASALIPGTQPNILFSQRQQQAGASNLLNMLGIPQAVGLSASTITPASAGGEVRRQSKELNGYIADLASDRNTDPLWVRAELKKGKSPQTIAAIIASGRAPKNGTYSPQSRLPKKG